MADTYQKKELLSLMAQPPNKTCVDCGTPSPQWASVSYGTYVCLECSGAHRGLGVHLSFIRSLTMDKWNPDQMEKMRQGGNDKFKEFIRAYGPEGGWDDKASIAEKYKTWAAAQYREKLSTEIAGGTFTKSSPPASFNKKPTPNQSTTQNRSSFSNNPSRTSSPFSNGAQGEQGERGGQRRANEDFFAGLGAANEGRREDLAPSQGGKYVGFGSAPLPSSSNPNHPSFSLSSHSAPSLTDFQKDPLSALSKGWGLFSSAVAAAGSTINESVIQPGIQTASTTVGDLQSGDPRELTGKLALGAKGAGGWLSSVAGEGWARANQLAQQQQGSRAGHSGWDEEEDLTERLAHLRSNGGSKYEGYEGYGRVNDSRSGGSQGQGQGQGQDGWGAWGEESSALHREEKTGKNKEDKWDADW